MIPRGIRLNNPLCIRHGSKWQGLAEVQTDKVFCRFVSMTYGARAALKLMRNHISGFNGRRSPCNTLRKLIYRWAPPTENKTSAYLSFVCKKTGYKPSLILHVNDRKELIDIAVAMALMECGQAVSRDYFETAFDLLV